MRASWSGSIQFGMVCVPVKMAPASRPGDGVKFNRVEASTGERIRQQTVSAVSGVPLESAEIVRGFELAGGGYVTVTDDDLAAVAPEASKTVDLVGFVDAADVDLGSLVDRCYAVWPDGRAAEKPYALLVDALESSGRVAVARFVMRTREHVAALRAVGGRLVLSTLVYADEVAEPPEVAPVELSAAERAAAAALVDAFAVEWDHAAFVDRHKAAVLEMIDAKAGGELVPVVPAAVDPAGVVDLLAALEASVAAVAAEREPVAA